MWPNKSHILCKPAEFGFMLPKEPKVIQAEEDMQKNETKKAYKL